MPVIAELLHRARQLASMAEDQAAQLAYLEILRAEPTHFEALNELALVALATGHRSAARTAYRQAVLCHPDNPVGRVNLGNLYFQDGELEAARTQYAAALAVAGEFAPAHQGLARTLEQLGEVAAAEPHWRRGFTGHATVVQRHRGTGPAIPVLLLVSARYGNVSTPLLLDDRLFQVTALYVDHCDPDEPLPVHALVFNAVGDADLCGPTLERAAAVAARSAAPLINAPERVLRTGRLPNAQRLGALPGVIAPLTRLIDRRSLQACGELEFPLLIRTPGHHMGSHFVKVDRREELAPAIAGLPGEALLAIEHLDARGGDGMYRKYRVMFIDGELYPLHLAISAGWKVHYFSAAMASVPHFRDEEQRFLDGMAAVLGPAALSALALINRALRLDYAGIDFGLRADGSVLLFEANATMVIVPPPPDPMWDYRRPAIERCLDAAKRMVRRRATAPAVEPRTAEPRMIPEPHSGSR